MCDGQFFHEGLCTKVCGCIFDPIASLGDAPVSLSSAIYHPPKADDPSIREHLFQSLSLVESEYPNCGILATGNNCLDISGLLGHFGLKQSTNS